MGCDVIKALWRYHRRAWQSMTWLNKWCVWAVIGVFLMCILTPVIANDKPLWVRYQGAYFFPIIKSYPETTFGGVFESETNYQDPAVQALIQSQGALTMPMIAFAADTIDRRVAIGQQHPMPPSRVHWLGTDDVGRDVLARILYGLRVSLFFGLFLTVACVVLGVGIGVVQGFYGGWVDLLGQRATEVWRGLPELLIVMVVASVLPTGVVVLFVLMMAFGWVMVAQLVRAEVLRVRQLGFVLAAKAMGATNRQILLRHILPNALVGCLSQLPFVLTGNILALTALDFLGFGLPQGSASLGELLVQGKNNLDAPWIALSAFFSLTLVLALLMFVGDGIKGVLGVGTRSS